jgi:hypothetical protein
MWLPIAARAYNAPIQQPRRRTIAARVQEVSLWCAYTSGQIN